MAARLQREEEEEARRDASNAGAGAVEENGITDEELARLLQEEEQEAADEARREAEVRQRQRQQQDAEMQRPPFGPGAAGASDSGCGHCLEVMPMALGCGSHVPKDVGAVSGCMIGCQLAVCCGLNSMLVCICMACGACIGYASSGAPPRALERSGAPMRGVARRRPRIMRDDSDEDSSDEDIDGVGPDGVQAEVIEGRSVEHVYQSRSRQASAESSTRPVEDDTKCMVCMEPFTEGVLLRTLPCLHRYHKSCVDEWLRRKSTCPICKRDITDTSAPPPVNNRSRGRRGRRVPGCRQQ